MPDSITIQDAVNEIQTLTPTQKLNIWRGKLSNILKVIDQTSSYNRSVIRTDKIPTSWPYHPVDIDKESFVVPSYLQPFMLDSLTADPENEKPSNKVVMLMQSFSQDFMYAVSCGQ